MTEAERILGVSVTSDTLTITGGGVAAMFRPLPADRCWEAHCGVDPAMRGAAGRLVLRSFLAWWWARGCCDRLFTVARTTNQPARHLIADLGFSRCGLRIERDGVSYQPYEMVRTC